MTTLIKNGRLFDAKNNIDSICDLLLQDGSIANIAPSIDTPADQIIDATNLTILPGLVDMHVHLRDPGFIHKEDIMTGCEAAAAGGVTSLLCMPNTKPVIDSPKVVQYIQEKAKDAKARVYITGAITKRLSGEKLCDFQALKKAGVIAVSDDGRPVENGGMMMQAIAESAKHGLFVTSHCEDLSIIDGGIINDGAVAKQLGVKGMSRASEDSITARDIILAESQGLPMHIAHVSTKGSVQLIREAKARGAKVTAETAAHYFTMTEQELLKEDADYRMNPPLREEADRLAILEGLLDGTLDCIVTDHAPHTPHEKQDFYNAPNGVIGMETSFSASYTALVKTGAMTLGQLLRKMCYNPANIMGIDAGDLAVGSTADLILVDLEQQWTVDPTQSHSRSQNCVFKGHTLTAQVQYTFVGGQLVFAR